MGKFALDNKKYNSLHEDRERQFMGQGAQGSQQQVSEFALDELPQTTTVANGNFDANAT